MIPEFDDNGYLPPGVHLATLAEIEERFGSQSDIRRDQMESLRWMLEAAAKAGGVLRIVINGSFVTDVLEPNDVDCAILIASNFDKHSLAANDLRNGFPFLTPDLVTEKDFRYLVESYFDTDRDGVPKGMIEILI